MTSNAAAETSTPWFLWPFHALWRLLSFVLNLTGRLLCGVLGLVFLLVGGVLTMTVIGAVIGVPLGLFGFLLMLRAIF